MSAPPVPHAGKIPTAPIRQAIHALRAYSHGLLARLRATLAASPGHDLLPDALQPNPAAERRVTTALHWLRALAVTLRGDITYLQKARFQSYNLPSPPDPTLRVITEAEREHRRAANRHAAQTRRIRASFARDPVGKITARLCHRLDIHPGHKLYPTHLIAITQTPAQWAHRVIATRLRAILEPLGLTDADAMPHDILRAVYGPSMRPPPRRPRPPH